MARDLCKIHGGVFDPMSGDDCPLRAHYGMDAPEDADVRAMRCQSARYLRSDSRGVKSANVGPDVERVAAFYEFSDRERLAFATR